MNRKKLARKVRRKRKHVRTVAVRVALEGGHVHDLELREDASELVSLFRVLGSRGQPGRQPAEEFFQIALENGQAACSFNSSQLISVTTRPPVVVQLEKPLKAATTPATPAPAPIITHSPPHLVIDDFLNVDEHRDMLAFAVANEDSFDAGTVEGQPSHHRQNLVILDFNKFAHSTLICNRLLTWYPQLAKSMGMDLFPMETVESQLTANNDGHFYGAHQDSGGQSAKQRVLTCVYYFFQDPRPFSGGALRLYDHWRDGGQLRRADTYKEVNPVSNRLVVFPSLTYHELMPIRCPSRRFEDSRFAITNWIRRHNDTDTDMTFGWGHMRCRQVPSNFGSKDNPR